MRIWNQRQFNLKFYQKIECESNPKKKQLDWNQDDPSLKQKMESFWPKKLSPAELKYDPRFRVIEEYLSQIDSILRVKLSIWLLISSQFELLKQLSFWLSIYSKFDSNILQLVGISGRI